MYYRFYKFKINRTLVGGITTSDTVVTKSSRIFEWSVGQSIAKVLEYAVDNNFRIVTYESEKSYMADVLFGKNHLPNCKKRFDNFTE